MSEGFDWDLLNVWEVSWSRYEASVETVVVKRPQTTLATKQTISNTFVSLLRQSTQIQFCQALFLRDEQPIKRNPLYLNSRVETVKKGMFFSISKSHTNKKSMTRCHHPNQIFQSPTPEHKETYPRSNAKIMQVYRFSRI